MCELCHGAKVVHNEIMRGVVVVQACPNCTNAVHEHYEKELDDLCKQSVLVTTTRR